MGSWEVQLKNPSTSKLQQYSNKKWRKVGTGVLFLPGGGPTVRDTLNVFSEESFWRAARLEQRQNT